VLLDRQGFQQGGQERMGTRGQKLDIDLEENEIIIGDLNAHDQLWDEKGTPDERGRNLMESLLDIRGVTLHERKKHTRIDPGTGSRTSPDLTIAHETAVHRHSWDTMDKLNSEIMLNAAYSHIGLKKTKTNHAIWMNREMEVAIEEKNTEFKCAETKVKQRQEDRDMETEGHREGGLLREVWNTE
jgi:hypothetical protein